MTTHELKSWPGQSRAMWTGLKRAENRRDDRGYGVGDFRQWLRVRRIERRATSAQEGA